MPDDAYRLLIVSLLSGSLGGGGKALWWYAGSSRLWEGKSNELAAGWARERGRWGRRDE